MITRYQNDVKTGIPENDKKERETPEGKDDACRCKDVSAMKPRDLIRLMISDLAFWKKGKK